MEKYCIYNVVDTFICIGLGNDTVDKRVYKQIQGLNEEEWKKIWEIVNIQQIWEIVFQGIKTLTKKCAIKIPDDIYHKFIYMEKILTVQYYQMFSFTSYVQGFLEKNKIPYHVLKGIAMDSLYPNRGMRKITDLDIYIPKRKHYKQLNKILKQEGFTSRKEIWDYHKSYYKLFGQKEYLLELHTRLAGRMGVSFKGEDEIYNKFVQASYQPEYYHIFKISFPVLQPTDFALQLLLHMMNHILVEEVYFSMLCDWTVFWNVKGKEIDREEFNKLLLVSGLQKFAYSITGICITHFGLKRENVDWFEENFDLDGADNVLYRNIVQKTNQENKKDKMFAILWNDSPRYIICFKEMHRQMRLRFPHLKKVVILWPALWCIVLGIFLYNNKALNRESSIQMFQKEDDEKLVLKKIGLMNRGKK